MNSFKDEVFCSECGANLALGIESTIVNEESNKAYIKRVLYLTCSNQNCPAQAKRVELPNA